MDGIDKNDYTHMGHPRYIDLETVKNQVICAKRDNPNKNLKKVVMVMSLESYPPQNTYQVVMS